MTKTQNEITRRWHPRSRGPKPEGQSNGWFWANLGNHTCSEVPSWGLQVSLDPRVLQAADGNADVLAEPRRWLPESGQGGSPQRLRSHQTGRCLFLGCMRIGRAIQGSEELPTCTHYSIYIYIWNQLPESSKTNSTKHQVKPQLLLGQDRHVDHGVCDHIY